MMTTKEILDKLKKSYPHFNAVEDNIIDEIHKYVEEFCGYGGVHSDDYDEGFSDAVIMALALIDHFSKEAISDIEPFKINLEYSDRVLTISEENKTGVSVNIDGEMLEDITSNIADEVAKYVFNNNM